MDIPSIEELNEEKKNLHKIPEETVFRKHIPNR